MSPFESAPCVGLSWLFDSTDESDHQDARRRCLRCLALDPCRALLEREVAAAKGMRDVGGPRGTWAGELVGKGGRSLAREHGTDRGYHQHRHVREPACDDCRAAHAAAVRARKVAS